MPRQEVIKKANRDARQGKSPSTQAGEFVKDEIDRIREGEHGARSAKQAIAIGLSEARRAGVKIPRRGKKAKAAKKTAIHRKPSSETSGKRAQASLKALRREPTSTVSKKSLSKQAKSAVAKRGHSSLHRSAKKAAHTRAEQAR